MLRPIRTCLFTFELNIFLLVFFFVIFIIFTKYGSTSHARVLPRHCLRTKR
ncbi:unnamed protein product [Tenebrio molitor]|nr:unnamed protein product [Tenebrio molitor]